MESTFSLRLYFNKIVILYNNSRYLVPPKNVATSCLVAMLQVCPPLSNSNIDCSKYILSKVRNESLCITNLQWSWYLIKNCILQLIIIINKQITMVSMHAHTHQQKRHDQIRLQCNNNSLPVVRIRWNDLLKTSKFNLYLIEQRNRRFYDNIHYIYSKFI